MGVVATLLSDLVIRGTERIRLQITDRSVARCNQQDAINRLGFRICIVEYVFGIPVSLLLRVLWTAGWLSEYE